MRFGTRQPSRKKSVKLSISQCQVSNDGLSYTRYAKEGVDLKGRVVLLHGFTQNAASFSQIASELSMNSPIETLCVDLPFHGASSNVAADLDHAADLLYPFGPDSIWVGYSLGARYLLSLCLKHAKYRWKVIFSGVNPGIENELERQARYDDDLKLAARLQVLEGDPEGFGTFLAEWVSLPIFRPRTSSSEDIKTRLKNSPSNLARSLQSTSVGIQPNLWPLLGNLRGEITIITGGEDAKYLEIAGQIGSRIAGLEGLALKQEVIAGFGHSAIFDRPEVLLDSVFSLLAKEQ